MSVYTIDVESQKRLRNPANIDNLATRYETYNGTYTFTSPQLFRLEMNIFLLLKDSIQIPLKSEYHYKPEYLSYDQYGTVTLAKILMYVNGIYSPEEFVLDTITIPTLSTIMKVVSQKKTDDKDITNW